MAWYDYLNPLNLLKVFQAAPTEVHYGADFAASQVQQPYAAADMAAFSAFPWVYACAKAIIDDLAGLPLVAYEGEGADAKRLKAHPAIPLVSSHLRRQMALDSALTGNAYALIASSLVPKQPRQLQRLHPERVTVYGDDLRGVGGYQHQAGGASYEYPPERVLHVRDASWQSGPQELLGQSAIRVLHRTLDVEIKAERLGVTSAGTGRPDVVISPDSENVIWEEEARKSIREAYKEKMAKDGILVLSNGAKVDFPRHNPRDLEFVDSRKLGRESILAVFGVPPTRVGLPTANYATSQQQDIVYWRTLQARAAIIDEQLTRLARMFPGSERVTIRHDFSAVPALQASRTERLDRVSTWVMLGMDASAAAAYEGFTDAPFTAAKPATETPAAAPTPPKKAVKAADRDARWLAWSKALQQPHTRLIGRAAREALAAQRDRVLARVAEEDGTGAKDIASDILARLFPPAEISLFRASLEAQIRDAIRAGYAYAASLIGTDTDGRIDAQAESQIGALVTNVSATTKAEIQRQVTEALAAGEGVGGLQERLTNSTAFSPSRALLIGRTEATKAVNAGSQAAYQAALSAGVVVQQEWLSARDSEVRDPHTALDGQVQPVGGTFTVPAGDYMGATATGPGLFANVALNANCRCCVLPVVEEG